MIINTDDKNIYELLIPDDYDIGAIQSNNFILQPYQTIPKYYLLSNNNINTLILNYSTGSGKSSCGVFFLMNNLNIMKMFKFNEHFAMKNINENSVSQNLQNIGKISIVCNWAGHKIITNELLRSEFNFITIQQREKLDELLKSNILEKRQEGERLRDKLVKKIDKYIDFYGYQAFFNACFPNKKNEKYTQDASVLLIEYEQNNIQIDVMFLEKLRNSILIVDEMQKLYSSIGLNSYGFAILMICKVAKKYNIKIMMLTGTMINSSLTEVIDILNIINPDKKLLKKSDYLESFELMPEIQGFKLKKSKEQEIINLFHDNFMYYNQSAKITNVEKPKLLNYEQTSKLFVIDEKRGFYCYSDTNILHNKNKFSNYIKNAKNILTKNNTKKNNNPELKFLVYDEKKHLPREIYVGNTMINTENSLQPLLLYSVTVHGFQKKGYKQYIQNVMKYNPALNDDENDNIVSIQDAGLPNKNEWLKYGIQYQNGLFYGKFLKLENLYKYSAIGVNMCKTCINNIRHNEKTIVYHNKIKNFGIEQYALILESNGFIKYKNNPKKDSLCKSCGNTYELHTESLEERLKHKCCNNFTGMIYTLLIGDLKQDERDSINETFNSPNNLYGDIIAVMFVSDVAYSGVSFFNTNNIMLLSRISNISKWKQICARIIRTYSHALLPKNKHYAKIYTMIINYPDELNVFDKLKKFTIGEQYYKIRELLNNDIEYFIDKLSNKCIGNTLLKNPKKYKISNAENTLLNRLFLTDLNNEIKFIMKRILFDNLTRIWDFETLISRIKDSNYSVSYLNLSTIPKSYLENLILQNKYIKLFKYNTDNIVRNENVNKNIVRNENDNIKHETKLVLEHKPYWNSIYDKNNKVENNKVGNENVKNNKNKNENVKNNDNRIWCYLDLGENDDIITNTSTFSFNKLLFVNLSKKSFNQLFENLEKTKTYTEKIDTLKKIMKFVKNKYELLLDHKIFWDSMYDIHNEYYDNDETNFFENHYSKNRNISKMTGFYYGKIIIMKNASVKQINYSFPEISKWNNIPYLFKITCLNMTESSPFYLHVNIIRSSKETNDQRKINKGIVCTSLELSTINKYFPEINKNINKKIWCQELLELLINKQYEDKNIKAVYSPFEK